MLSMTFMPMIGKMMTWTATVITPVSRTNHFSGCPAAVRLLLKWLMGNQDCKQTSSSCSHKKLQTNPSICNIKKLSLKIAA